LTRAIQTAMAQIDGLCGRSFETTTQARFFDPLTPTILDIGWASQVSSVDIDVDADFVYETNVPANEWTISTDAKSRRFIQLLTTATVSFPMGQGTVQVTGIFGEIDAPPEVEQATLLQSARLWKRADAIFAEIRSENGLMRLTSDFDLDAKRILSDAGWLRTRNIVMA